MTETDSKTAAPNAADELRRRRADQIQRQVEASQAASREILRQRAAARRLALEDAERRRRRRRHGGLDMDGADDGAAAGSAALAKQQVADARQRVTARRTLHRDVVQQELELLVKGQTSAAAAIQLKAVLAPMHPASTLTAPVAMTPRERQRLIVLMSP
ncbi:hypothetical protein CXG81DRAFT_26620 [Caulochytrium protostelioides]|uniref:Uncharacterized protein n=1 Tax=Caulochytrium protostelioides TaxID=1555241 RepID=A0A4P9X676_9FUNG|nr:hypothetical protein CXG81DRAFT_26620 [Caulochytrium protostelioides]|eukprot:RKP00674.1 hypothetical protein CXG81DRAFT_26620 [Caulochytrium protostelioides]